MEGSSLSLSLADPWQHWWKPGRALAGQLKKHRGVCVTGGWWTRDHISHAEPRTHLRPPAWITAQGSRICMLPSSPPGQDPRLSLSQPWPLIGSLSGSPTPVPCLPSPEELCWLPCSLYLIERRWPRVRESKAGRGRGEAKL